MSLIVRAPQVEAPRDDYIELAALTYNEIRYCAYHALDRRISAMREKRDRYGQKHVPTWDDEVESTCAEYALCKYKGIPWTGLIRIGERDCGGEEVRHTVHLHGHLTINERDEVTNERPLVLMVGRAPIYRIAGWAYVREGKQAIYWNPDRECYWYPQKYLHPYEKVLL